MNRVAIELKTLRMGKGLTQERLADLYGTTQDRICKIENGHLRIKADEYLELRDFILDVELVDRVMYFPRHNTMMKV